MINCKVCKEGFYFWWLLCLNTSRIAQTLDNKSSDTQQVIILDLWELPSQKYLVYLPSSGAAAVLGQVKNVP